MSKYTNMAEQYLWLPHSESKSRNGTSLLGRNVEQPLFSQMAVLERRNMVLAGVVSISVFLLVVQAQNLVEM